MPAAVARSASSVPTCFALAVLSPAESRIDASRVDADTSVLPTASSTLEASIRGSEGDKTDKAKQVGALLAERATTAGITAAVFDRGGHAYHGRVAALADSAREGGLAL